MIYRVGVINVPTNVGPIAWLRCWVIMAARSSVFGVNETLSRRAKAVYRAAAAARGWGQVSKGTPNPIYFNRRKWRKVPGSHVVKLHDAGTGGHARAYPGFNGPRFATVATLVRRGTGERHVIICAHLVPAQHVDPTWRDQVRAESIASLRALVTDYVSNGAIVWVMGDMNGADSFHLGKRFMWIRGNHTDELGVAVPVGYVVGDTEVLTPRAPTDHKTGVVGRVEINEEKS